jgi:hypothetical protein
LTPGIFDRRGDPASTCAARDGGVPVAPRRLVRLSRVVTIDVRRETARFVPDRSSTRAWNGTAHAGLSRRSGFRRPQRAEPIARRALAARGAPA